MKIIRKIAGVFLYLMLIWCFVYSWHVHQAKVKPGQEKLISTFVNKQPSQPTFEVSIPDLVPGQTKGDFRCSLNILKEVCKLSGSGSWDYQGIDINLNTSGEISKLLTPFLPKSIFISGNYSLQLHIQGSWTQIHILGTAELHNGVIYSLSTGLHLQDISVQMTAQNDELTINTFSANDGKGGKMTGRGKAELAGAFPYVFDMQLTNLLLVQLKHIQSICSGELQLKGDRTKQLLSGNLAIQNLQLALDQNKPSPKTVDVIYVNGPKDEVSPKAKPDFPINLDIRLTAPNNIFINDHDLASEWKAALHLEGSSTTPLLHGNLEMLSGNYTIGGKPVYLKAGSIDFEGDPIKNTTLSVIGVIEAASIIAEALVSGPLTNPSLTLRSTPPLSQAEILSHLIFGHGLASITPQQSRQLKRSIKELQSMSSSSDMFDDMRSRLGIDRIEINRGTGSELEDVSLQIGKYLAKGLYVAFNKSITSTSNCLVVEASLSPNLKLQAEINDNAEGQLHLKWRHDY